jgi:hypothetical protein
MWRYVLSSFLLVSFVIQTFSTSFLVLNFYADQKYIAKKFCINRNKPQMKCCGKCQLTKKLSQEENKDKQNPERKFENKEEVIYSNSFSSFSEPNWKFIKRLYLPYQEGFFSPSSYTFFHPPRMV